MSFRSKTRQSSVITLVVALFLLTTAVFAFAGDSTDTAATSGSTDSVTSETLAIADAGVTSASATDQDAATKPLQGCDQAAEGPGGPYDSTCDGSPSGNGNGGGTATGKPCAGCVGAADDKNPQGQMPDATDGNNGYECDGNSGIAKTNPAHTGCSATTIVTTTTTPVTTTTTPTTTTMPEEDKAEICHATGSETNPFVRIGPAPVGVIYGHLGMDHQNGEDIIPPFTYNGVEYSQNWDAAGQAIFADPDCNPPAVTTTTAPTTTTLPEDVTLCHATGSEEVPFAKITVTAAEAYTDHYLVDAEDIIPPFSYNGTDYELNWDAEGQAVYDVDCFVLGTTIVNTTTTQATTTTTEATTTTMATTTTGPTVLPTQITQVGGVGGPHPNKVLPRRNPPDRTLPFTGSDPSPFLGMAGVLMALGGSLVLASRRRYARTF